MTGARAGSHLGRPLREAASAVRPAGRPEKSNKSSLSVEQKRPVWLAGGDRGEGGEREALTGMNSQCWGQAGCQQ